MNRIGFFVLTLACVLLVGCGGSGPAPRSPEDLDKVKGHVQTALDAWKAGGSADKLKSLQPPIEIVDPDWKTGAKLTQYDLQKVEGNQKENVRCWVKLTMQAKGKSAEREVVYDVNMGDKIIIGRDPFH
jgi:hypothetical protein